MDIRSTAFRYQNELLRSFDGELIARLQLSPVVFKAGQMIKQPGKPIKNLYFLESGTASMTMLFRTGIEVQVGMFGREAVIGASALIGSVQSLNHVYCQIEGTGWRCSYEDARREFESSPVFRKLSLRYIQAQLVQSFQAAGCAAIHDTDERLACWLLMTADRVQMESFRISQEFLGHMVGSTRPTALVSTATLKQEGLLDYKRGAIHILDRRGLEARACECYRANRNHLASYQRPEASAAPIASSPLYANAG